MKKFKTDDVRLIASSALFLPFRHYKYRGACENVLVSGSINGSRLLNLVQYKYADVSTYLLLFVQLISTTLKHYRQNMKKKKKEKERKVRRKRKSEKWLQVQSKVEAGKRKKGKRKAGTEEGRSED
jgi:hypothetical protein